MCGWTREIVIDLNFKPQTKEAIETKSKRKKRNKREARKILYGWGWCLSLVPSSMAENKKGFSLEIELSDNWREEI
jgi:hypothetical protein